jgi:chemotaxis protein MotB
MKTFTLITAVMMLILSSCVSSKKYNEKVSTWEKKYIELSADYDRLQTDLEELNEVTTESMLYNEQILQEKDLALKEEARKLQELKSLLDEQRNAIIALKQEVCSALKCFTPEELTIEVREGKLYVSMSDKLLFPSGSDMVNSRGKEAVSMLAAVLTNSDLEIMVEGHTDNVPISSSRNKDNWDLSVHRATSVTRLLVEYGISEDRIIASGRGEFHPLRPNENVSGRQSNRRTEIVLAPKLDKLWKLTETDENSAVITDKLN